MSTAAYHEPYRLPAGILALVVHGAFFALLYFGFTWQTQPVATMSVELWQSLPEAVVAPPPPPPESKVEEVVQPKPRIEEVVPLPPEEVVVKPEIVLPEKKKVEVKPVEKKPEEKKPVEKKPVEKKPAEKKPAEKKPEIDTRAAEQKAARERAEQIAREQAEQAEHERAEQAAATGRVVDEYTARIQGKIRRNIVMPPDVANDARAEFLVTLLPGGTVLNARLVKPSGNPAYDDAVERAIIKSQPLPLPPDIAMFNRFRELRLGFKPTE